MIFTKFGIDKTIFCVIIILVPEDEEAYFNGVLQFYNLNEEVA